LEDFLIELLLKIISAIITPATKPIKIPNGGKKNKPTREPIKAPRAPTLVAPKNLAPQKPAE